MQHGPGAENAFGGVAQAFSESSPILVIPGGYPRHLAHYYPNFNSTLNMQHITKWAEPLTSGRSVPDVLRRAFFQLRNGRPGPVLHRGAGRPVERGGARTAGSTCRASPPAARPTRPTVAEAARVLAAARAPGDLRGPGRALRAGLGRAEGPGRGLEHPGHHLHRGQERLPGGSPAVARQRRAGESPAGQALPGRRRRHPGRRLQLRADRLRRGHAVRQDDHPRHPRPDGPEQGRGGAVRPDRRRPADPDGAEPGDGRPRQVARRLARQDVPARDRRAARGLAGGMGAQAGATTPRRSTPTGSSPS